MNPNGFESDREEQSCIENLARRNAQEEEQREMYERELAEREVLASEYVKRGDVISAIGIEVDFTHHGQTETLRDKINAIPAADVAPVKRGEWAKDGACDQCGVSSMKGADAMFYSSYKPDFCPNCGADMRGEK